MQTMPSIQVSGADEKAGLRYPGHERDGVDERRTREALTAVVQRAVEQLGYSVSGPLLGQPAELAKGPKAFTPRCKMSLTFQKGF